MPNINLTRGILLLKTDQGTTIQKVLVETQLTPCDTLVKCRLHKIPSTLLTPRENAGSEDHQVQTTEDPVLQETNPSETIEPDVCQCSDENLSEISPGLRNDLGPDNADCDTNAQKVESNIDFQENFDGDAAECCANFTKVDSDESNINMQENLGLHATEYSTNLPDADLEQVNRLVPEPCQEMPKDLPENPVSTPTKILIKVTKDPGTSRCKSMIEIIIRASGAGENQCQCPRKFKSEISTEAPKKSSPVKIPFTDSDDESVANLCPCDTNKKFCSGMRLAEPETVPEDEKDLVFDAFKSREDDKQALIFASKEKSLISVIDASFMDKNKAGSSQVSPSSTIPDAKPARSVSFPNPEDWEAMMQKEKARPVEAISYNDDSGQDEGDGDYSDSDNIASDISEDRDQDVAAEVSSSEEEEQDRKKGEYHAVYLDCQLRRVKSTESRLYLFRTPYDMNQHTFQKNPDDPDPLLKPVPSEDTIKIRKAAFGRSGKMARSISDISMASSTSSMYAQLSQVSLETSVRTFSKIEVMNKLRKLEHVAYTIDTRLRKERGKPGRKYKEQPQGQEISTSAQKEIEEKIGMDVSPRKRRIDINKQDFCLHTFGVGDCTCLK